MEAAVPAEYRSEDIEITIEANPGTVDYDQLCQLRASGVNRLSLGVQSLDDSMLRQLGRIHSADQAREAYNWARQAGFSNVNLDFIFGLPSQTLEHWRQTLQAALEMAPEHLSLYALTVEEGTPLNAQVEDGGITLPEEDLVADMYQLAEDLLAEAGYEHYELSNWGRPGKESRHNLAYWANVDYLGLGAGAHSHLGGHRLANLGEPREYIEKIASKQSPRESDEEISFDLAMAETVFLGLRRSRGVERRAFATRFGRELDQVYGAAIEDLCQLGLLSADDDGIRLTRRGRLLGNEVFVRFMPLVSTH
jgi:oxygen-independent coproporphyrinogen-3 oxidase